MIVTDNSLTAAMPAGTTALVADDVSTIRGAVKRIIELCGCVALEANSITETHDVLESHRVDVLFQNLYLPNPTAGERALVDIKKKYPDLPVVLTSCAVVDFAMRRKYQSLGAEACLQLPFYEDKCTEVLSNLNQKSNIGYLAGIT